MVKIKIKLVKLLLKRYYNKFNSLKQRKKRYQPRVKVRGNSDSKYKKQIVTNK